ncbi:PLP-dependent aminotransferase family protein [Nocardia sp. CA-129566]|uniref:MocR-like pyridoxine biosynthesis transcription factor PdxR n=1 Tax=Nocardia sp. CA-129566 TaxID=3239976 RepID=UPI003D97680A
MHRSGTRISAAEVLVRLDRTSSVPLRTQLEQQLRHRVQSGDLPAGTVLPSTRVLADDLGVSRRLIVEAYQQLVAEGVLAASERSRTIVARVGPGVEPPTPTAPRTFRYDLRPGVPALSEFPRADWLRSLTTAVRHAPDAMLDYPDAQGCELLRQVVAQYLRRVRAVDADPDRIVICAGFTQALALLTAVLDSPVVGLENPGLVSRERIITSAGGSCVPVTVDRHGLRVDELGEAIDVVVVTPTHQFPLGVELSPQRTAQLLEWVGSDRLVIEDDYDSEFRYNRQPVRALQGQAPDSVVYVGTISKTLAPALRLGWMVLPQTLIDRVVAAKRDHDTGSPVIEQLALADLIGSGAYERHLRHIRRLYRQRRDRLLSSLRDHIPDVEVTGASGGLHLVVELPRSPDPALLVAAAQELDVAVNDLGRYGMTDDVDGDCRLVLGYANTRPEGLDRAVALLAEAVASISSA